jgi:hypothetical protein
MQHPTLRWSSQIDCVGGFKLELQQPINDNPVLSAERQG